MGVKLKKIILFILFLSFSGKVWATNYVEDANCQGAWLFKEGTGTTVDDSSANSNTGNFASSGHPAWSSDVPKTYTPYSVDYTVASSDFINCGNNSSLNVTGTVLSLVTWAQKKNYQNGIVISRGKGGVGGYVFELYDDFAAMKMTKYGVIDIFILGVPNDSNWHHYAGVWTSGNNNLYVDGVAQTANTNTSNFISSTGNFIFGVGGWSEDYFNGLQAETAMFSDTLTSTEVNDIMDNGLVGAPPAGKITRHNWNIDGVSGRFLIQ